ncbi:MAG: BREX-4 system phosphatase PglZ [Mediterraneibacter sp.]
MRCSNTSECFEQISAYFDGKKTGHFLLVNSENYDSYQEIRQRLEADSSKKCVYVSQNCLPNGLPDVDAAISIASGSSNYALVGLSQAQMLRSFDALAAKLDEVLSCSISGYGIILLEHCEQTLQKFMNRDVRVKNRVVLVDGEVSPLPQIRLAKTVDECVGFQPLPDFPRLLTYLERLTNMQQQDQPVVTTLSSFSVDLFQNAVYSVTAYEGIYDALTTKYSDIVGATEKVYGTDAQWRWLAFKMSGKSSFSELICDEFGATANLSAHLSDVWESGDEKMQWLLWLALKSFGEANNHYLTLILGNCDSVDSFEIHVYLDFADIDISHSEFERYYKERKRLLEQLPENLPLIKKYCDKLGRHQKEEVFYLTDCSTQEKYDFVRCLSLYDYTPAEITCATRSMSKSLHLYMQDFVFDAVNTKLPESDSSFRDDLTTYFRDYKLQKLTNRIFPDFQKRVNAYAQSPRPYNKLQPRSSIISHMDKKNVQCFFFDALGVEYLAFIMAKCEEYGLVSEVAIGHCDLPSITGKNKEFLQYFKDGDWRKIDDLDEIKHHSQVYDYRKCEYPLHLFEELDVIDEQLRMIQSMLVQGILEKALIVSDHGASRLAVRYDHELNSRIELDESGEHSGRCCPAAEDPNLSFAAYEDGFAVLANYERFKGGRRANVEVHGGASLEEVLVPIITLTKRPDNIELCFVHPVIELKPRIAPELVLYSNIPLSKPRLLIDDDFYDGEFIADKKHVKFVIPKIKRKGNYFADVYDGEKNMSVKLDFKVQRHTREVELF